MDLSNELDIPHIQWFPGHMKKAQRLVEENLKLVDIIIELRDARLPSSSANLMLTKIISHKMRIIALNKADLADLRSTKLWLKSFKEQNVVAVAIDSISGHGLKNLIKSVEEIAHSKKEKVSQKTKVMRAIRCMVVGTPNVGKSSLINRLAGSAKTKTENRPGVTRAKQWIKVNSRLEILDMPGILWPKFDDQSVALKLAFTGAINDEIYDKERVAILLAEFLRAKYPQKLVDRFHLTSLDDLPTNGQDILEFLGRKRGFLLKGGTIDIEKTVTMLFNEFRSGKLGKITLELPPVSTIGEER